MERLRISSGCGEKRNCRNRRVLQRNKADNNHDLRDRLNAWPPLRELQHGQGTAHDKAGYTNATALTTGSKKLSSLLVGRVHIRIVRRHFITA